MRAIRASEISAFLYCKRAWWYQLQGVRSENEAELSGGSAFHRRHGRRVLAARLARALGWALLLAALALATIALTGKLFS
jgi:CRISPR/Cas system-associated exonuclease Cas4 (RecB family)